MTAEGRELMGRALDEVYVHPVWATWNREPWIDEAWESRLHACLRQASTDLGCPVLAVGGVADHVHLLVRLPTTVTIADLVKQAKGTSSHWVNHEAAGPSFRWQGRYAAISVSPSSIDRVRAYIERQREHHASGDVRTMYEMS